MWPLHIFQVLTWLIGSVDVLYTFGEVFPYFRYKAMLICFIIAFILLTLVVLILDIILTLSDPTDPVVYQERLKLQKELATLSSENTDGVF